MIKGEQNLNFNQTPEDTICHDDSVVHPAENDINERTQRHFNARSEINSSIILSQNKYFQEPKKKIEIDKSKEMAEQLLKNEIKNLYSKAYKPSKRGETKRELRSISSNTLSHKAKTRRTTGALAEMENLTSSAIYSEMKAAQSQKTTYRPPKCHPSHSPNLIVRSLNYFVKHTPVRPSTQEEQPHKNKIQELARELDIMELVDFSEVSSPIERESPITSFEDSLPQM